MKLLSFQEVYLLPEGSPLTMPNGSEAVVVKRLICTQLVRITTAKGYHKVGDCLYR